MGSIGDQWRCELCCHGTACGMHRTGACGYGHSLAELLPPRERDREYLGACRNAVDRYFGQHMNEAQLDRIMFYYNRTPGPERPVWSSCMAWFYQYLDLCMLPELGWDFGLRRSGLLTSVTGRRPASAGRIPRRIVSMRRVCSSIAAELLCASCSLTMPSTSIWL